MCHSLPSHQPAHAQQVPLPIPPTRLRSGCSSLRSHEPAALQVRLPTSHEPARQVPLPIPFHEPAQQVPPLTLTMGGLPTHDYRPQLYAAGAAPYLLWAYS